MTPWVVGYNTRARLALAPKQVRQNVEGRLIGVEIMLDPGWKTYWRQPGEAGGIPPRIDLSGSKNVKSTRILYPAPKRFIDKYGESIGYKDRVLFPVEIIPSNSGAAMEIKLKLDYGVCKDICIPASAEFALYVPGGAAGAEQMTPVFRASLQKVPKMGGKLPHLKNTAARFTGDAPELLVDVSYAPGSSNHDLFIEADNEMYVPSVEPISNIGDTLVRYRIDLTRSEGVEYFKGRTLKLTMVSSAGNTTANWTLPQ